MTKLRQSNKNTYATFKKQRSRHLVPSPHGRQMGKKWKQWQIFFSWAPKLLWILTAAMKFRRLLLGRKAMTNLDSVLKSFANKGPYSQSYDFSSSHVWM